MLKVTRLLLGRKLMKIYFRTIKAAAIPGVWHCVMADQCQRHTSDHCAMCLQEAVAEVGAGGGDGQGEGWSSPLQLSHFLLPDLDGGRGESGCVSASKPDGRTQSSFIKHQWPTWWEPNVVCPNQGFLTQSSLPAGSWQRFCVSGVLNRALYYILNILVFWAKFVIFLMD